MLARIEIFKKYDGFTLIEFVLVITVVGILAVSMMHAIDTSGPSIELARRKIASDLRYAQSRALTTKQVYGFRTLSSTSYEIYQNSPGNPVIDPATGQSMTVNLNEKYGSVIFSQINYQISFNGNGTTNVAEDYSISVGISDNTKNILIFSGSGAITLP